jgi:ketosteroid isomerase-like protein
MKNPIHTKLVETFYHALAIMDADLLASVQAEDVVYNISGHTPISGRIVGQAAIKQQILPPVFSGLKLDGFQFAKKWKIMCQDENRVVCFMEADGFGVNGVRYDQRYVHVFGFRDDKISEYYEFFDTALADAVLFTPAAAVTKPAALEPFVF